MWDFRFQLRVNQFTHPARAPIHALATCMASPSLSTAPSIATATPAELHSSSTSFSGNNTAASLQDSITRRSAKPSLLVAAGENEVSVWDPIQGSCVRCIQYFSPFTSATSSSAAATTAYPRTGATVAGTTPTATGRASALSKLSTIPGGNLWHKELGNPPEQCAGIRAVVVMPSTSTKVVYSFRLEISAVSACEVGILTDQPMSDRHCRHLCYWLPALSVLFAAGRQAHLRSHTSFADQVSILHMNHRQSNSTRSLMKKPRCQCFTRFGLKEEV